MKTYVAEIDGRAVLAFRAENEREADAWLHTSEAIRDDLAVLENEGRPLWDGESEISVRYASNGETALWRQRAAERTEEDGDPLDDVIVFLVPVTDPMDDDE
jgi:hypothetical protein